MMSVCRDGEWREQGASINSPRFVTHAMSCTRIFLNACGSFASVGVRNEQRAVSSKALPAGFQGQCLAVVWRKGEWKREIRKRDQEANISRFFVVTSVGILVSYLPSVI